MNFINYNLVSLEDSVELWNDCFSDYPTPMIMTGDSLTARVTKFGLSEELSFIISEKDRCVGLILIGVKEFAGVKTSWIGGMGIRPSARKLGYAKAILDEMLRRMKVYGVKIIKFEVLSNNVKAKQLYIDKGYSVINELGIYQGSLSKVVRTDLSMVSSVSQNEHENTPWQNRKRFNKSFDFVLGDKKIGELVLDEISDQGQYSLLIIRQLVIPDNYFDQALSSINQKYNNISIMWSNFDESDRVTQRLSEYGFKKINSQLQLKKEL